jgi:hypothetical protein
VNFLSKHHDLAIEAEPWENPEGLFGQIFLWVFEVLPYLEERGIFPEWNISGDHYGQVIPGALDLAYEPRPGPKRQIKLAHLRSRHRYIIGSDWHRLSALFNTYFRVPDRISAQAADQGILSDAIGVHYRGHDKHKVGWDSNPVTPDDFLIIITQFYKERPELRRIFLATDDEAFHEFLKRNIPLDVVNLGAVGFHKDPSSLQRLGALKADRAMLDCVLLSRCGAVLLTQSALSAFAKVLNPDLEIYRVGASKLFHNTPYFPVAYIPVYRSKSSEVAAIVDRLIQGDWTQTADYPQFATPFAYRRYWSPALRLFYSWLREVRGFGWIVGVPNLLAEIRRRISPATRG